MFFFFDTNKIWIKKTPQLVFLHCGSGHTRESPSNETYLHSTTTHPLLLVYGVSTLCLGLVRFTHKNQLVRVCETILLP